MAGRLLKRVGTRIKALHRDERGADMLEYILIIAAIALPLLALLLIFRGWIWEKVQEWWEDIVGRSEEGTEG